MNNTKLLMIDIPAEDISKIDDSKTCPENVLLEDGLYIYQYLN